MAAQQISPHRLKSITGAILLALGFLILFVNLERIVRIEPYGKKSRIAILADGARLPVSRAGYARLQALLDERK
jgi:LytTr DNA-binding domain